MKSFKLPLCVLLVFALLMTPVLGFAQDADVSEVEVAAEVAEVADAADVAEAADVVDAADEAPETAEVVADAEAPAFSYSGGIDENGFWEGIVALDHVQLPVYRGMLIPSETHAISDEAIQAKIDEMLAGFATGENVTDRAVEDGDTVNIDYVGSVDGVEFSGGSTGGAGTDVTIGVTSYIDDFLEQLIGHVPGETFDINVTFPADYGVENLNGKDAVFDTTINHIVASVTPELNDAFVAEKLSADNGWVTVEEMRESIREDLKQAAIQAYIQGQLADGSAVESMPESLLTYQVGVMMDYFTQYAAYFGMDVDSFVTAYMGVASADELATLYAEGNTKSANVCLMVQAIAEDAGIAVTDDDVAAYFKEEQGQDDISSYVAQYGMPYLKQSVINSRVMELITENAVLGE